jgi:CDP-6-deoxy-D-xylo-4-hexulose-3-dehydrase
MTRQPFFGKYVKNMFLENSNARLVHEQGLYFGNNPELTKEEIKSVVTLFTR